MYYVFCMLIIIIIIGKIVCYQSAVPKIGHHIAEAICLCNDCQAAIVNKNLNMNFSF